MNKQVIYLCAVGSENDCAKLQYAAQSNFPDYEIHVVIVSTSDKEIKSSFANATILSIDNVNAPEPNLITQAFYQYFKNITNPIILFSSNRFINGIAARLSALLNSLIVTGVNDLEHSDDQLKLIKKAYSGALNRTTVTDVNETMIITMNTSDDKHTSVDKLEATDIKHIQLNLNNVKNICFNNLSDEEEINLNDANVVVAGGRGLKNSDQFELLKTLANNLNAAVGASRPAVDSGWANNSMMIGQSGKTVSPEVYFAIGISGTIQHTTGMEDSKCVIAVNTDKNAPIFKLADYGVIGDAQKVVKVLIKKTAK